MTRLKDHLDILGPRYVRRWEHDRHFHILLGLCPRISLLLFDSTLGTRINATSLLPWSYFHLVLIHDSGVVVPPPRGNVAIVRSSTQTNIVHYMVIVILFIHDTTNRLGLAFFGCFNGDALSGGNDCGGGERVDHCNDVNKQGDDPPAVIERGTVAHYQEENGGCQTNQRHWIVLTLDRSHSSRSAGVSSFSSSVMIL